MENNEFSFCEKCMSEVEFTVKEQTVTQMFHGCECTYIAKKAICTKCNNEVDVNSVNDANLKSLYDSYRKQNNLLSLEQVQEIPQMYSIGIRPLSKILGFGEITYTRFVEGDIPSKQNNELLFHVYNNPHFYKDLLEQNKLLISKIAYEKSKKAVNEQINKKLKGNSSLEKIANYLIIKCGDITPLTLQKALYYIQGFFYAFFNRFIFSEDCEAWAHGPVYKDIYEEYKEYKYNPIEIEQGEFTLDVSDCEKEVIDTVIKYFCCYNGKVLESFTHSESPWNNAIEQKALIITKEQIGECFAKIKLKYKIETPDDIKKYATERFLEFIG